MQIIKMIRQLKKFNNSGNRSQLILAVPMIFGIMLALFLLRFRYGEKRTNFEELALGDGTSSLFCEYQGFPIHVKGIGDLRPCIQGWHIRGKNPVVLWLGNSQVHAVNQLKLNQKNAPPILFRRLYKQGFDLVTASQPNASLQEHYVLFEYLKSRLSVKILILPLVFDDLRETGLRVDIALALKDPKVVASLEAREIGRKILKQVAKNKDFFSDESGSEDLKGVRNTIQEHSELAINKWLSEHSTLWNLRPEVRGDLFAKLYILRNTILGITAQSKRRVIAPRYDANISALTAILERADESGIKVLVYIVPIRNDIALPYVQEEYKAFKQKAEVLINKEGGVFLNLEELVPISFWGEKESTSMGGNNLELDFMHFQSEGHRLLAETLGESIDAKFLGEKQ